MARSDVRLCHFRLELSLADVRHHGVIHHSDKPRSADDGRRIQPGEPGAIRSRVRPAKPVSHAAELIGYRGPGPDRRRAADDLRDAGNLWNALADRCGQLVRVWAARRWS